MKRILGSLAVIAASASAALAGSAYAPEPPSVSGGGSADGALILLLLIGAVIWSGQRNAGTATRNDNDLSAEDDDTIMKF